MLKTPLFWQSKNLISKALVPFSLIYQLFGTIRALIARPYRAKATIICIGNNIVGGSGKTSIVMRLCQVLNKKSVNFCTVTYGPGGSLIGPVLINNTYSISALGDEALMLSHFAPTIVAKNKSYGVKLADKLGFDYVLVDDGLQNPNFSKDYAICVYNSQIKNNGYIFPAGPNRESLKVTTDNSDLIICFGDVLNDKNKKIIKAKKHFTPLFKGEEVIAFCSIANPALFIQALENNGATVKKFYEFPDHFLYHEGDLEFISSAFKKNKPIIVTTFKDYVKLPPKFQKRVIVLKESVEINNEDTILNEILKQKN